MPQPKKKWERISFLIGDDGSIPGSPIYDRIHHCDISYTTKDQYKTAIARAAVKALHTMAIVTVDTATQKVFKHVQDNTLRQVASYSTAPIDPPALEDEAEGLFESFGEAA